ncbi:MAG TPA: hypothetical protein VF094_08860 [Gaiellaceae bacterium]
MTGFYETWLYAFDELEETCGHQHVTLEGAWACARSFNAVDPFDVVWVRDGTVQYNCRREAEMDDHDEPDEP